MRREELREEGVTIGQRLVNPQYLPPTRSHQIQSGGRIVNPQYLPPTRTAMIQGNGGPFGWDPPYRDFPFHFGNQVSAPNRRREE